MPNAVRAWNNQPELKAAAVELMRPAATFEDEAAATAHRSAFIETEALATVAHGALEAIQDAAEARFHAAAGPILAAAKQVRLAEQSGRPPDPADAAARVRETVQAVGAECAHYCRWRADRLVRSLSGRR